MKSTQWCFRCLAIVLAGTSPQLARAGVFPDPHWQEASPESQAVNSEKRSEAMGYLQANAGGPGAEALVVRHGYLIWKGTKLLNPQWVDEATQCQVRAGLPHGGYRADTDGRGTYGYNWWVNGIKPDGKRPWPSAPPKTYLARGFNINVCFVVPEWDLLLVRMAKSDDPGTGFDAFWEAVFARLAPGVDPRR